MSATHLFCLSTSGCPQELSTLLITHTRVIHGSKYPCIPVYTRVTTKITVDALEYSHDNPHLWITIVHNLCRELPRPSRSVVPRVFEGNSASSRRNSNIARLSTAVVHTVNNLHPCNLLPLKGMHRCQGGRIEHSYAQLYPQLWITMFTACARGPRHDGRPRRQQGFDGDPRRNS